MKLTTFSALILVCFLSCTSSKSKEKHDSLISAQVLKSKDIPTDTIKVNGKAVVFFSISQMEYDSMVKGKSSGIDEALRDFNYYAKVVADTIKKQDYKSFMTTSRYIQVVFDNNTTKTFDRLSDKENSTGYILTNGQKEPQIEYGMGTDIDFLMTFDEFKKK